MAMPSLSQARDVVAVFISKVAAQKGYAPAPSTETDPGPDLSKKLFRLLRRSFGQEARETMVLNKDLQRYVENFPEYLIRFTGENLSKSLARKLNHTLNIQTHSLYKVGKGRRKRHVVSFTAPKLNPNDLYRRFAVRLKEEGLDVTPEQLRQMVETEGTYVIDSRDRPIYDASDVKASSSVQRDKAISTLHEVLNDLIMDPSKFLKFVVAQSEVSEEKAEAIQTRRELMSAATTWLKPPAGKTTSGKEEEEKTKPGGGRPMDPRVERFLKQAMQEKRPVRWKYKAVRTEGGKSRPAFNMLDFTLPGLGDKTYSVKVPDDIAKAVKDQREGETNHFEIVGYDEEKGFKVKFLEQLDELRKSSAKAVSEAGIDHQVLNSALQKAIIDHVSDVVKPSIMGDVADVVKDVLGKVIVSGKDISTSGGIEELAQETERRLTVADPHSKTKKDEGGLDPYSAYKEYKRRQKELAEEHETAIGPEISKAMAKGETTEKIMEKLVDMIARDSSVPEKASFNIRNLKTWNMSNAFNTKDTVRWLVRTIVDYAMQPTAKGAVRWNEFLERLFKSRDLASPEMARMLAGGRDVDDLMMAMKLVMEAQSGRLNIAKKDSQEKKKMQERYQLLNDYHNDRLKVTPEERRQIVEAIASKGSAALRMFVKGIQNQIKEAFINLYQRGDPEAVRIVNMSHVRKDEPVSKQEKAERGLDEKKRVKRESLRPRMEALRQKSEREEGAVIQAVRDLEDMLVERKLENAENFLKERGAPTKALKRVRELSKLDYSSPSAPDYEKAMVEIEKISDDLESTLSKATPKKNVGKKTEKVPAAEKEAMYLQVIKMAMENSFAR